jgi:hypothetical protein
MGKKRSARTTANENEKFEAPFPWRRAVTKLLPQNNNGTRSGCPKASALVIG